MKLASDRTRWVNIIIQVLCLVNVRSQTQDIHVVQIIAKIHRGDTYCSLDKPKGKPGQHGHGSDGEENRHNDIISGRGGGDIYAFVGGIHV